MWVWGVFLINERVVVGVWVGFGCGGVFVTESLISVVVGFIDFSRKCYHDFFYFDFYGTSEK